MAIKVDIVGKRALVTGTGALGESIAAAFFRNGATVHRSGEGEGPAPATEVLPQAAIDIFVMLALDGSIEVPAAAFACRNVATAMTDSGRIVIVGSALGLVPARDEATASIRAAGLFALTRTLAMELGPRLAVNALAVGPLEGDDGISARMISHVPLKRAAQVEEITTAVLFLADPANAYMTGHILAVDGGWIAGYARDF